MLFMLVSPHRGATPLPLYLCLLCPPYLSPPYPWEVTPSLPLNKSEHT